VNGDPGLQARRARLAALDLEILEALNARLALVKDLKAYKEAQGLPFLDPAQEARVLDDLCRANPGPLPEAGLRELFSHILAWSKRG
jgi:chorismate mutase